MGQAFTAEQNDLYLLYYNPAGIATLRYPLLTIQHQELILDSRFENISLAYPLLGGYLAASNSIFWVPPFDKIDIDGNVVGKVVYFNGVFTLGYGYNLGFMFLGGSIKYIYQRIDTQFYNAVAFDIGVLRGFRLFTPFDAPSQNLHIGLSLLNLGSSVAGSPLPRQIRLGLSYKITNWLGFNVDFIESMIDFTDLYDFTSGFDESFRINTGIEFSYLDLIALRAGYRFNDTGTYTLGLGFNYVIGDVTFTVDAAYADAGIFGATYSFTVAFKLIPKVVTIQDRKDADKAYRRAIRYYVAGDIDSSINEFKKTKDTNPYHKNIDKRIRDLEKLKELMEENKKLDMKEINEKTPEIEPDKEAEDIH